MKKLLVLLLCAFLIFSCGNDKEEKSSSIVSCSITENIWINETNQMDFPSFATDSAHYGFYVALRFMENHNIEFYRCGESFINKNSDIINNLDPIGVWGNNQYISDTSCYRILDDNYFEMFGMFKWEKIADNSFIIIYPNKGLPQGSTPYYEGNDTINLIDCNTLECIDGIRILNRLVPGATQDPSFYYNRSPKLHDI